MAERYKRIYYSDEEMYYPNAPVLIEARAILKDNKFNKILAQIKIKNISENTIIAAIIKIRTFDSISEIAEEFSYEYLDLDVSRDSEFGQQTPIYLEVDRARSFTVDVVKIVYDRKNIWEKEPAFNFNIIDKKDELKSKYNNALVEIYQKMHGNDKKYIPKKIASLWICSCGAVNFNTEEKCHVCHDSYNSLMKDLDEEKLIAEELKDKYNKAVDKMNTASNESELKNIAYVFQSLKDYLDSNELATKCFVKAEEARRESVYKRAVSNVESDDINIIKNGISELNTITDWKDSKIWIKKAEEKIANILEKELHLKKRNKTIIVSFVVGIALMIGCKIGFSQYNLKVKIPQRKYEEANKLFDKEKYEDAKVLFSEIINYKDSKTLIKKCDECINYEKAKSREEDEEKDIQTILHMIDEGNTYEAIELYNKLGNSPRKSEIIDKLIDAITEKIKQVTSMNYFELDNIYNSLVSLKNLIEDDTYDALICDFEKKCMYVSLFSGNIYYSKIVNGNSISDIKEVYNKKYLEFVSEKEDLVRYKTILSKVIDISSNYTNNYYRNNIGNADVCIELTIYYDKTKKYIIIKRGQLYPEIRDFINVNYKLVAIDNDSIIIKNIDDGDLFELTGNGEIHTYDNYSGDKDITFDIDWY